MGEPSSYPAIGNSSNMINGGYENYEYTSSNNQARTGFAALVNHFKSSAVKPIMDNLFEHIIKLYDDLVNNWDAIQSVISTFLDGVVNQWKELLKRLSAPFLGFFELIGNMGSIQVMRAVSV